MKFNFLSTAALVLGVSLSSYASAEVMTVSESFDIIEEAQDFTFSFDALPENIVGGVTLIINASGDFGSNNETLSFDGLLLNDSGVRGESLDFTEQSFASEILNEGQDVTFTATFDVADVLVDSFSSDAFELFASTSSRVSTFFARGFNNTDADFVQVSFSFNVAEVSEPTTLAIFGLGLMGLAARRFKKNA